MELSERPPMMLNQANNNMASSEVYQNASDYPHIVIGGKPFFLVPTSAVDTTTNSSEVYAYPQQMPIYEVSLMFFIYSPFYICVV